MLNVFLVLENNHAATLIGLWHVLRECPLVSPHLEHVNWHFGRLTSSCPPRILRFGGLPGARRVEGGRMESSSDSESSSSETTVGGEWIASLLTFASPSVQQIRAENSWRIRKESTFPHQAWTPTFGTIGRLSFCDQCEELQALDICEQPRSTF